MINSSVAQRIIIFNCLEWYEQCWLLIQFSYHFCLQRINYFRSQSIHLLNALFKTNHIFYCILYCINCVFIDRIIRINYFGSQPKLIIKSAYIRLCTHIFFYTIFYFVGSLYPVLGLIFPTHSFLIHFLC
jgi:hypothetical protein